MRWIWIDRFEEFCSGRSARAIKVVSMAEDHLHDLYPGYPIMPNALIIEGLAQTGGILVGEANRFEEKVVLAKLPFVKFHDYAVPGDVLEYHVDLVDLRPEGGVCDAKVFRQGQLLAEAQIFFAHLDKSRGADDENSARSFVFTKDHLIALLRMARGTYQEGAAAPGTEDRAERGGQNGRVG